MLKNFLCPYPDLQSNFTSPCTFIKSYKVQFELPLGEVQLPLVLNVYQVLHCKSTEKLIAEMNFDLW